MHEDNRNRPVSAAQSAENREISSKRWVVGRDIWNLKR